MAAITSDCSSPRPRRWRTWVRTACCLALLGGVSRDPVALADGVLSQIRSDVHGDDRPADANRDDDHRGRPSCSADQEDESGGLLSVVFFTTGRVVWGIGTAPFWAPRTLIEDHGTDADFPLYPYFEGHPGYLVTCPRDQPFCGEHVWPWATIASVEHIIQSNDDVSSLGLRLLVDTGARFGIDAEARLLSERLTGGGCDELWLGDANLVYRFAQSETVQMRAGVGLNWLTDRFDTDLGVNFTYGGDWFVHRPLVVSAEVEWGTLGSSDRFHARTTIGASLRHFEFYTGYDYLEIGGTGLHGWVNGIRIWY